MTELQQNAATALNIQHSNEELVFFNEDTVLTCIENAGEHITVVRDPVMGLLSEFVTMSYSRGEDDLPERYWPVRDHKRFMLLALASNGQALRFASDELRADRDLVRVAVAQCDHALKHASDELRADPDVVRAALAQDSSALRYASAELRADQDVVLAAVVRHGSALEYASPSSRPTETSC